MFQFPVAQFVWEQMLNVALEGVDTVFIADEELEAFFVVGGALFVALVDENGRLARSVRGRNRQNALRTFEFGVWS